MMSIISSKAPEQNLSTKTAGPGVTRKDPLKELLSLARLVSGAGFAALSFFNSETISITSDEEWCPFALENAVFKAYYLAHPEILIISDVSSSTLFGQSISQKYCTVKSFAGLPLTDDQGVLIGHLSLSDKSLIELAEPQIWGLQAIARQAATLVDLQEKALRLKKEHEDSRNSEELMKTIFEHASDAVIVMDDYGVIFQWNPKAEEIFGWAANEVIGKSFRKTVISRRNYETYITHIDLVRANGKMPASNQTIEVLAYRNNQTELDITLGVFPATVQGRLFYICFASDITNRKLLAYKLDKQKEFYEIILNKLPTDIAVFDADHKYLFVNPGAIGNDEYRKYIIGKDDYEYAAYRNRDVSIAHSRREQFLEVKNTGKEIRWEDSLRNPTGDTITHLRRMYPVHNEKGELNMVIGFGLDITDRKVMEEKQAVLVQQLSSQNTQLVDFCNIVSHNLRAPLVNISMLVDFIEKSNEADEQKLLISKLSPVVANLHATFNELVESIQIRYDHEIKFDKINLNDCLERTKNLLEAEISNLDASIEADFSACAELSFPTKYLNSIFDNLISNALKYHSPKRKPVIKVQTKASKNSIIFSVGDNGLGVDLIKHKDSFFKIGKVFHRHPNAKGFGLFMTKTQVEAMGGKIWVESAPDEGCTFFIEFINQALCAQ